MSFVPDQRSDPDPEKRIRAEFAGVAPMDDYLADRGRVRILAYPIEPDLDAVVARCMRLLEEAFAVKPGEPFYYTPLARE
jgi:hypothetical protein